MKNGWDLSAAKDAWQRDGYLLLPGFHTAAETARYRALCDHALKQWRRADPEHGSVTNMAWLTDPAYWQDARDGLVALCEWVAAPRVLDLLTTLAGARILFNNTQYFAEPLSGRWRGIWHRDCQFLAADETAEQRIRSAFTGVHLRVAFLDDAAFSFVPGSHERPDSAAEATVRRASDEQKRRESEMPGAKHLRLKAGDALLFHAWGLHQGTYDAGTPRRTFDVIYQWGEPCTAFPPPPTCFLDERLMSALSPTAQTFFAQFVDVYRPYWNRGEHAWATS